MFGSFLKLAAAVLALNLLALGAGGARYASAQELCAEPALAETRPAFERFLEERGEPLKQEIRAGVCAGTNKPLPLPAQADIQAWFASEGRKAAEAELHSCFGRMFIAEIIEIRTKMEAYLEDSGCAESLCSDSGTGSSASEKPAAQVEGVQGGQGGLAGNMADIYDQNARDLMAIP